MNLKNAYRLIFAAYFGLFLWIMTRAGSSEQPMLLLGMCCVFAALSGYMLYLSIFKTRY